jgi:hypothetical protein
MLSVMAWEANGSDQPKGLFPSGPVLVTGPVAGACSARLFIEKAVRHKINADANAILFMKHSSGSQL